MNSIMTSILNRLRTLSPLAMLATLLSAPTAHAALINCANLNLNPGDYKVVLDEFGFASVSAKNNADLAALKERLQFSLNGQLDALKASAKKLNQNLQVPLRIVTCVGRQPSPNGDEFTDELAEHLSDERVVVEMWGTLDLKTVAGANASPRAMIGYAIPPVQRYAENEVPAIQVLVYPKKGSALSAEELENLPELAAFALVGLGTKASRASHYDLAVWAFSRAEAGILDAQLGGSTDQLDALLVYVKNAACTTRSRARTDQAYSGPLKLLPAQTCGGAP
jgi:hypothetical protein